MLHVLEISFRFFLAYYSKYRSILISLVSLSLSVTLLAYKPPCNTPALIPCPLLEDFRNDVAAR